MAALAAAAAPAAAEEAVDWRAAAVGDIRAAYAIYAGNHPAMHDPANPDFPALLARARDEALEHAEAAADEVGYHDSLGAFSSVLQDGHARLLPNATGNGAGLDWPGFVTAWRGDGLFIHHAVPSAPVAVGERLLACDEAPVERIVRRRLLTSGFRPAEAGQWWRLAPRAFLPASGDRTRLPAACTVRAADGSERDVTLSWSAAPDDIEVLAALATDGERTPIGLTEPRPDLFLIGMPTFSPDAGGVAAYRRLFAELGERRSELSAARAVIVDLRHNGGGSSEWSMEAARALWGRETVVAAMADHFKDVRIWWRASEGNTAYMAELEKMFRNDGNDEFAGFVSKIGAGMAAAKAAGEPFYVEDDEEDEAKPGPIPPSDFAAPIYVIASGRCASACLDALDVFTRFPNTRLIGAPTSADTTYMETRTEELPSGHGRVVIPNKIWVGRPRASGEFYRPHIPVDDLDWSTATFLDRIEQDLAARR